MSCHPPAQRVGPFRPEDGLTTDQQDSWPYTDLHVKPYAKRHVKVYADKDREVLVFHPRDGKVVEVWQYIDDQYTYDEFFS
jgi:hypothetical protein